MKATSALSLAAVAAGHGAMNLPRPRNSGTQAVHPSPGNDRSCIGDACFWYQVGCFIGCDECSSKGKSLYPDPTCSNPIEPTNNDPSTRSWDPHGQSTHGDFTKYHPWRAPGKAPVVDPCGDASGFDAPNPYVEVPKGYNVFDKGTEVLPEGAPTYWKAGGTAEVGWAIAAQHGGGYSYRLCPKTSSPTEECFQSGHLSFTSRNTTIRYHDGSRDDFSIPFATFTTAEGQQWRRNPIPGCACDAGINCRAAGEAPNPNATHSLHSHVELTDNIDWTAYSQAGAPTTDCPHGTMFEPGWSEGTNPGYLVNHPKEWSIIDEVQVPNTPGAYILSWRWDCEETPQVWSSCADIVITSGDTPSPSPSPPPAPPAPSPDPTPAPKPGKGCKGMENPTCKGFPFEKREMCWYYGCMKCAEDNSNCEMCCKGCELVEDGKTYCDQKDTADVVV